MKWFGCFLILILPVLAYGQSAQSISTGQPFIQHYLPQEYRGEPQNWAITQGKEGTMYVGNGIGVLIFDGNKWERTSTTNNSVVRSLATSKNGTVYIGATSEFGYLKPSTEDGSHSYFSLKEKLDSTFHGFGDVWQILPAGDKIYFNAGEYVFAYHESSGQLDAVNRTPRSFHRAYGIDNQFFVIERGKGLMTIKEDTLALAGLGADIFQNKRLYAMIPYNQTQVLYGVANEGLFIAPKPSYKTPLVLKPFGTEVDRWMKENFLYLGTKLNNGNIMLGTLGGGAAEIDTKGHLIRSFNQTNGLTTNSIYFIYQNAEGAVWLAMSKGITQLEIGTPTTYWGAKEGLSEAVIALAYHNNRLYAGTFDGLYQYNKQKFTPVEGVSDYCWALKSITLSPNKKARLFTTSREGIYEIIDGKGKLISRPIPYNTIYHSDDYPNKLIVCYSQGIITLEEQADGNWKEEIIIESHEEFREIGIQNGNIWACTLYDGIYQIKPDSSGNGFQAIVHNENELSKGSYKVIRVGNELWVSNEYGNAYIIQGEKLYPVEEKSKWWQELSKYIPHTQIITYATQTASANWLLAEDKARTDGIHTPLLLIKKANESIQPESNILGGLPNSEIFSTLAIGDSLFYVGNTEGLFSINLKHEKPKVNLQAFISRTILNEDSTIFWGGGDGQATLEMPLPYQSNSIQFEYAGNYYQASQKVKFRHFLKGHDESWSSWSIKRSKEYTDLYEGTYTMYVEMQTPYGEISQQGSYMFIINPPIYRTWWAYCIYAIISIVFIVTVAKLNSYRHKQKSKRLAQMVEERTKEVTAKNHEIQEQNETLNASKLIIEKRNKDINDSVNAAKRILHALHTKPEEVLHILPESLVFLQPREAVSGDFFWLEEVGGKVFIAAVDCTGHGIPGAFMSVIGHTLLKDTIYLYQTDEVDQILNNLHYLVANSLSKKQEGSIEGMDMSLCMIDKKNGYVEFAGARNPLVYITNGEVHTIKGDRLPVGGIKLEKTRSFSKHRIPISQDTCFYMFSDGFQDQFGGERGKSKYTSKRFYQLLLNIHQLPMDIQKEKLQTTFNDWKGKHRQIDDVLVLGFKLNAT